MWGGKKKKAKPKRSLENLGGGATGIVSEKKPKLHVAPQKRERTKGVPRTRDPLY